MDSFLGSVMLFAGNFAPKGWAFCKGQSVSVAQNMALFAIIGVTYGGNGTTEFCLPNLKSTAINGASGAAELNYIICLEGIFPQRD